MSRLSFQMGLSVEEIGKDRLEGLWDVVNSGVCLRYGAKLRSLRKF